MKSRIIFDFNGTLTNTLDIQLKSWEETLKKFNLYDYYDVAFQGINRGLSSYEIAEKFPVDNIETVIKYKRKLFQYYSCENFILFPNQKNVLEYLSLFYELCIVSQTHIKQIEDWLRVTELKDYFSIIRGRKSHKECVDKNKLVKKTLSSYHKNIFIGDTLKDFEIANNLEIDFILLNAENKIIEKEMNCKVICNFVELINLLNNYYE